MMDIFTKARQTDREYFTFIVLQQVADLLDDAGIDLLCNALCVLSPSDAASGLKSLAMPEKKRPGVVFKSLNGVPFSGNAGVQASVAANLFKRMSDGKQVEQLNEAISANNAALQAGGEEVVNKDNFKSTPSEGLGFNSAVDFIERNSDGITRFLGGIAPGVGALIGARFGNMQLGSTLGSIAGAGFTAAALPSANPNNAGTSPITSLAPAKRGSRPDYVDTQFVE